MQNFAARVLFCLRLKSWFKFSFSLVESSQASSPNVHLSVLAPLLCLATSAARNYASLAWNSSVLPPVEVYVSRPLDRLPKIRSDRQQLCSGLLALLVSLCIATKRTVSKVISKESESLLFALLFLARPYLLSPSPPGKVAL